MFVFARTLGSRIYAHPIGGKLIEPDPPEAEAVETVDVAAEIESVADQDE